MITKDEFLSWPERGPGWVACDGQPIRVDPDDESHTVWEEGHGPISPVAYAVRCSMRRDGLLPQLRTEP